MSQTNGHYDPLAELKNEVSEGQLYRDERSSGRSSNNELRVVYLDDNALVLRYPTEDGPRHTITNRQQFERAVSSGRYELIEPGTESPRMPDDFDSIRALIRRMLEQYEGMGTRVGNHKAEAMVEIYDEIEALAEGDVEEIDFEEVPGIGAGAAENLREAGFHTAMDVRRVDREDLINVPLMGESNTDNLLEYIDG